MARIPQALRDARRRRVASLVLRGMTQREIEEELGNPGDSRDPIVNPLTGKPFSLGTIHNDIKALQAKWQEAAGQDINEHRARLLAEVQEAKRAAWAQQDLKTVLKAIDRECDLLGVNAPQVVDLLSGGRPIGVKTVVIDQSAGTGLAADGERGEE